ncbi:hypothetical protein SAMN04488072_104111 [Lentibacillus halodurans]|uniref:Uncharacterized protein n=1 Tax=Lentibacillus halodurans TaxID=237679 RepID=A0A1I0X3P3_9BACI|nr:hypothetical protein SAMN04488072_104111 [Lentibacillus halodurans]
MLEILDAAPSNVDQHGFFGLRSKPNSDGYKSLFQPIRKV